jgi:hypothetical protein
MVGRAGESVCNRDGLIYVNTRIWRRLLCDRAGLYIHRRVRAHAVAGAPVLVVLDCRNVLFSVGT